MAAFALTGCTIGGDHTYDLTIEVPTNNNNNTGGQQGGVSLPQVKSDVTIISYIAGDYVHHHRQTHKDVLPGTTILPITLGEVPLGKSTLVIEAKAAWKDANGKEKAIGYYGEQEIFVQGGVNTYGIHVDYGVVVECKDSDFYSRQFQKEDNSNQNVELVDGKKNIGRQPLAAGDFLILRQGKKASQQKNFTSRLPNFTSDGDWRFKGYGVCFDTNPTYKYKWLFDKDTNNQDLVYPAPTHNKQPSSGECDYRQGEQVVHLYSVWKSQLTRISVNKKYTGNYVTGDTITDDDIEVTAYYTDGSDAPVTGWTTNEKFSAAAPNGKEITISYTEDGITKTDTITITIINGYTFSTDVKTLTGYSGTAGTGGTYVEFGDWPQTIKEPSVIIDEANTRKKEMGMFTYYLGNDGNWYCKALENAYGTGSQYKYSNGDQVKQVGVGSYQWFKVELIRWRVVTDSYTGANTSSGNKKLLVAESGLMAGVPYYKGDNRQIDGRIVYKNNYMHSKIRAWLNGIEYNESGSTNSEHKDKGFLQTAFSADAQSKIVQVEVDNSKESTGEIYHNNYACANTSDKIFLLSQKEATDSSYFADNANTIRKPTDFVLANYAKVSMEDDAYCYFFLRSPPSNSESEVRIFSNIISKSLTSYTMFSVVPALCINP